MEKHEQLYEDFISNLNEQERQWRETAEKAYLFGDKEQYIKLQIKSGIANMCRDIFIRTYRETYGEKI